MKGTMITNYPNYSVTLEGEIWSYAQKKPKLLKPQKASQNKKYLQVRLFNEENPKGKLHYIYRLVYETYVGEIPDGLTIDHIDGNPLNNNVDNLQVMTLGENSSKHNSKRKKLWDKQEEIQELYKSGVSQIKIAKMYGCSDVHIWRLVNNKINRKIKGKWRILDAKSNSVIE
jgi:hypothetical protein